MVNKILFVISNFSIGGAQRITLSLAKWMHEKGISVKIIGIGASIVNYTLPTEIECVCLEGKSNKDFFRVVRGLRRIVNLDKPDVVITMGVSTCIYSVLAISSVRGIKHIISERNDPRHFMGKPYVRKLSRFLMRSGDGFIFQTQEALEYYPTEIQKKGTIIPNPIMVKNIPDASLLDKQNKIVTMGRLTKQKNHKLLIDAFQCFIEEYPDYELHIFGSGELKEELVEYVDSTKYPKKVYLHSACNDVLQKISNAKFFVMSSDFEGMPNALIEAMSMGIPCISTDCPCGGPRFLIENRKNGLLVKTNDMDGMVAAMKEYASNDELCKKVSKESKKIKDFLSIESIGEKWLEYCEIVSHN